MAAEKREYTFAQTFPTGTHAMWLYYWMAAHGIDPIKDAKVITVPPPQMVANMRVGNMDGYCVGEPWGHRAIIDGIGITAQTTQDIWKDHPEKVLGTTAEFVKKNPNTCRAVTTASNIPSPYETFQQAVVLFSEPFYRKGPNDQGVGWNVLASLQRVALGFGLAALVDIPAGFAIGRFESLGRMFNPLISLLRPVSPLAWLPIGLMVFKGANPAAIWTLFICSIWPMVINTAVGVQRVPQDYLNVARVLNLSEWKIVTKILFPAVRPLHADRRAPGRGHRLAGDRGSRDADWRRGHRLLGLGRMEQPEREEHHHRHLCHRHRRPDAGIRAGQTGHRIYV